ncbi:MAG: DUF4123 domain-containing protein [Pseudomonadota bacterium]
MIDIAPEPHPASPFDGMWQADVTAVSPGEDWPTSLRNALFPAGPGDLKAYAVLDAAKIDTLPETLATSGLTHACLFNGKGADDLADAAPWLVALDPDNRVARDLFTESPAPWHLWRSDALIVLQSSLSFDAMRRHLRRFTRLRRDTGAWYYFRFWQPDLIGALAMRGPFTLPAMIFGADGVGAALLPTDGALLTLRPKPGIALSQTAPQLDTATWTALGDFVAARFFHRLRLDCAAQTHAPADHIDAVLDHLTAWDFQNRTTIRDLALWWCTRQGSQMLRETWAQDELAASRGMPDPIRADRLRNLADDRAEVDHAAG